MDFRVLITGRQGRRLRSLRVQCRRTVFRTQPTRQKGQQNHEHDTGWSSHDSSSFTMIVTLGKKGARMVWHGVFQHDTAAIFAHLSYSTFPPETTKCAVPDFGRKKRQSSPCVPEGNRRSTKLSSKRMVAPPYSSASTFLTTRDKRCSLSH